MYKVRMHNNALSEIRAVRMGWLDILVELVELFEFRNPLKMA